MTGPGDFALTADIAGSGHFVRAATLSILAPAFAAALQDFGNAGADPEARDARIYALAANVGGRCIFESLQAAKSAEACFQTRLISEWRVSIPGLGVLQALFHIAQLERRGGDGMYDIVFHLAGKPGFAALQREIAGIP